MQQQGFAIVVTCRESRDDPAIHWIRRNYHTDTVDIIAGPGSIGALANDPKGKQAQSILKKVQDSRNKQDTDLVAVVAHEDCTRDAATKEMQYHYLNAASDLIYTSGYPGDIIRLWVSTEGAVHQLP